jgi:hypothetical protein
MAVLCFVSSGEHDLKDVAIDDVLLCFSDHLLVHVLIRVCGHQLLRLFQSLAPVSISISSSISIPVPIPCSPDN